MIVVIRINSQTVFSNVLKLQQFGDQDQNFYNHNNNNSNNNNNNNSNNYNNNNNNNSNNNNAGNRNNNNDADNNTALILRYFYRSLSLLYLASHRI